MTEHTKKCLSYQDKMGIAFCNCDCSDEHVHEYIGYEDAWACSHEGCLRTLTYVEVQSRLNATEILGKTESLMIDHALYDKGYKPDSLARKTLRVYADALEAIQQAKDERR